MEDNENGKGIGRDWEDNPKETDADDYGLPHVIYDPLDKDPNSIDNELNDHHDLNKGRYYEYEEKRGFHPLLFFLILFIIGGIAFGVYWFQFRDAGGKTIVTHDNYQLPTPVRPEIIDQPMIMEEIIPPPDPVSATGEMQLVSSRSGSYYVVVGSFIDDDLAMDYSNLLNSQGMNTYMIEPVNNNKFYRLAVGTFSSWGEAADNLDGLKDSFGHEIWVLKY
jgi:hypothetical protein